MKMKTADTRTETGAQHLVRATMIAAVLVLSTTGVQAHDPNKAGTLNVKFRQKHNGQVLLYWKGKIRKPMARLFGQAIDRWKGRAKGGFIVSLNSTGGSVREAYAVIALLRKLKRTRDIRTYVGRGRTCGSMCVPIFLTGHKRIAAGASLWLFHDISGPAKNDRSRTIFKPWKTEKMFRDYFIPAGVPEAWVRGLRMQIKGSDYWITGGELFASNANIITFIRGNRVTRKLKTLARR